LQKNSRRGQRVEKDSKEGRIHLLKPSDPNPKKSKKQGRRKYPAFGQESVSPSRAGTGSVSPRVFNRIMSEQTRIMAKRVSKRPYQSGKAAVPKRQK
jgi:hypothetical protein